MSEVSDSHDIKILREMIEQHAAETGSALAKRILLHFDDKYLPHFKKIVPNDYQKMLTEIARAEEKGHSHDEAVLEAFKKLTA